MPSLSQLILIILTNLNNFNKIAFWVLYIGVILNIPKSVTLIYIVTFT